jgi:serine/threonine protein kinase
MMRCLSVEQLHALLVDDPSGPNSDRLACHVQHCTCCQEQLEQMTGAANRFADAARTAWRSEQPDEYEPAAGFLDRLQQSYRLLQGLPQETGSGRDTSNAGAQPGAIVGEECLPQVAGYEILAEVGRGATGVVYKARQHGLHRLVALKMLLDGPRAVHGQLARFHREAEAIAQLHHPNIVQIHDIGVQDGRPFFTMEFVAAGNLAKYLAGTPQDPRSAAQFVRTLAEAIHAAHRLGIVHRDLKPANILLQNSLTAEDAEERRGTAEASLPLRSSASSAVKDFTPKISDFGLAKQVALPPHQATPLLPAGVAAVRHELTGSGAILGTPSYMAPEQAQANGAPVGPRADVYALGAILYELLMGRPPFKAATPLETVLQVLHTDPVSPRRFQPAVPRDLETICLTCLHKEPRRRYADAEALSEDLRRFLAAEPIRARPAGWWERARKWARRRPASAALVGVSALAALGLVLGGLWHQRQLTAALKREQGEHDRAERVAREALDTMHRLVRVDDATAGGLQPEGFRGQMGREVAAFYQWLLADTDVQAESARQRVAAIHFDLGKIRQTLGQPEQAVQHLREACDLQEQLVTACPESAGYRAELVLTYLNLGALSAEIGRRSQAEELLRKARDLCEPLARENPNVPFDQSRLAQCYHTLGCFYLKQQGNAEPSRDAFEKAAALSERLVHDHPDIAAHQLALAEHHINLVLVYRALGKLDQAAASADKAVVILEAVTRGDPQELIHVHRLGTCYINRGYLAITTGRLEQALESYVRAVVTLETLYRKAPHLNYIRLDLASAHGGQADALMRLNRAAESLPHWKRLLELDEGPNRDVYRLRYSLAFVQAGDHAGAAAEAQALVAAANASGEMLYNAACVYSLCSHAVRGDEKTSSDYRDLLAENYAVRAIEALHKADAAGMFKTPADRQHLKNDPDLVPLLPRKDFQALLRALEHRSS